MASCHVVTDVDARPDIAAARTNLDVAKRNLRNVHYQFMPTLNAQSTATQVSPAPAFGAPPAMSPANANGIGYALGYLLFFTAGDANNAPCSQYVLPPAPTLGAYTLSTTVSTRSPQT